MNVSGRFTLVGVTEGTSVNGFLRVEGSPLVQRYTKGTNNYVPNFEKMADEQKPTVVPIMRDVTTGDAYAPNSYIWKYNGVEITWGPDSLSTNDTFKGVFNRITKTVNFGASTVTVQAVRVVKNLVPISGYDNDRISLSGSIEIEGQSIPFTEINKEVIIQETTGNAYDATIENDKNNGLNKDEGINSLTCKVIIRKDGVVVTDLSKFTFQWVKLLGTGDKNWGTAQTQKVTTEDVDNVLLLKCDVKESGTIVATAFTEITDFSDGYYVDFEITGVTGNAVRKGQTAHVKPVARSRKGGPDASVSTWNWNIRDNKGKPFNISGKSSATFSATAADITKADMDRAGGGLGGAVSCSF